MQRNGRPAYVTATDYGVSTSSGYGIVGVELNVYRQVPCDPDSNNGWRFKTEYAVEDMPFPTHEEADAYALLHGWIKEYTR